MYLVLLHIAGRFVASRIKICISTVHIAVNRTTFDEDLVFRFILYVIEAVPAVHTFTDYSAVFNRYPVFVDHRWGTCIRASDDRTLNFCISFNDYLIFLGYAVLTSASTSTADHGANAAARHGTAAYRNLIFDCGLRGAVPAVHGNYGTVFDGHLILVCVATIRITAIHTILTINRSAINENLIPRRGTRSL